MKKALLLLLALLTAASLVACNKDGDPNEDDLDKYKEEEIVYTSVTVESSTFHFETLDSESVVITGYEGPTSMHSITVPATVKTGASDDTTRKVTSIAPAAFYAVNSLEKVTIPEGVTEIGDYAFANCVQLTSISLPATLSKMGQGAFFGTGLQSLDLSTATGLSAIGDYVFGQCKQLTELTIPGHIKTIGFGAFANCTSLAKLVLAEGVEKVGNQAFQGTVALAELTLPSTFTNTDPLKDLAFSGSNVLYRENITCTGDAAIAYADAMVLEEKPDTPAAPPAGDPSGDPSGDPTP